MADQSALALLVAESLPVQKDLMIKLVEHLLLLADSQHTEPT